MTVLWHPEDSTSGFVEADGVSPVGYFRGLVLSLACCYLRFYKIAIAYAATPNQLNQNLCGWDPTLNFFEAPQLPPMYGKGWEPLFRASDQIACHASFSLWFHGPNCIPNQAWRRLGNWKRKMNVSGQIYITPGGGGAVQEGEGITKHSKG